MTNHDVRRTSVLDGLANANVWLGFLVDDEWVPVRAPNLELRSFEHALQRSPRTENLLAVCNRIALFLFRQGLGNESREVCRSQIACALRAEPSRSSHLAKYGLQAQVNLLRLEGYAGAPERALAGYRILERLAAGEPAELPDVPVSHSTVWSTHERLQKTARDVAIADVCKILWRRSLTERLSVEAARLVHTYPPGARTPLHAAVASSVIQPDRATMPDVRPDQPQWSVQLELARVLHNAAALSEHDASGARDRALWLLTHDVALARAFRTRPLRVRALAALADVLMRTGEIRSGVVLARSALAMSRAMQDDRLSEGIRRRIAAVGPETDEPAGSDPLDRERAIRLLSRVLGRLDEARTA
jgi:hypothetical protein